VGYGYTKQLVGRSCLNRSLCNKAASRIYF